MPSSRSGKPNGRTHDPEEDGARKDALLTPLARPDAGVVRDGVASPALGILLTFPG